MKPSFEIKICGINDEACMETAIEYQVDYIGLVFYNKSPRNVTIPFSKKLLKKRNNYTKIVALTVNPDDNVLSEIKHKINPDYIQLHGNETPNRCKEIKNKLNVSIIKGIGIKNKVSFNHDVEKFEEFCDILILDAPSTNLPGGNGYRFDWKILKNFNLKKKWMLAGGLNINNIDQAISIANPPAIDISSGLETKKGTKDPELLKNFILKCRNF